jgi:hypothetical protein
MEDIVVIPGSGVVVPLDAGPQELAQAWDELTMFERDLRSTKRQISDEITRRLDHEGKRSMEVDGVKFETTAPTEKQWDLFALQQVLRELVEEETISQTKADACLTWTPKAIWSELRTLLTDPRCKERVGHCMSEVPAARYAKVSRG